MKFKASVILAFLTGRFYCQTGESPTEFFGPLSEYLSGQSQTIFLPMVREDFAKHVWDCLPPDFYIECNNWEHSEIWRSECQRIDEKYGEIEIPPTKYTTAETINKIVFHRYKNHNKLS